MSFQRKYDIIGQNILTEKVESMDYFAKVHFSGRFRDYQQRVLDNAGDYLKDGKINIVAAPGSGKTVLVLNSFAASARRA